jgi:AcrR family transcriptional regulator
MSKRKGPNKENLQETRDAFIRIAIHEFTKHGYADASTSRIVDESGMARGSLYYHFGDKQGLFKAVYEHMLRNAAQKIHDRLEILGDPWDRFMLACHITLDLFAREDFRKILLIESQAALPFKTRHEIHDITLMALFQKLLSDLTGTGRFSHEKQETLPLFVFGILGEIGRALDFSDNIDADREKFGQAFDDLINRIAA